MYGKSAGMVWGRQDHLYNIRFLSVHMRLAPGANSGARFCGELVGARKEARSPDIRYRWFRARSQSLSSLGAFGGMVLIRQVRQNGSNRGIFCDFHFYCAMAQTGTLQLFPPFPTTGKNPFPKHLFFPHREKGQSRLGAFCLTCSLGLRVSIRASITNRMLN
jgi:hypothetical protein